MNSPRAAKQCSGNGIYEAATWTREWHRPVPSWQRTAWRQNHKIH